MSTSFITPGHVRAFQAVTTQLYGEVTLMSCLAVRAQPVGGMDVRSSAHGCKC